jgi:hypothetical protein
MRKRLPSAAFLLLGIPLAAMAVLSACGGDNSATDAGPDATTDVANDVAKLDAGPDVQDATCEPIDLNQILPSADAGIDVDAGGFALAACTGCLKSSCSSQIDACNNSCDCQQDVMGLVTCIGGGGSISQCFGNALASGNKQIIDLIGCASGNCLSACLPDGGATDSGSDSATEAAADATSE